MSRLLKILPFALALISVGVFAASCGSTSTRYRIVQTIPDVPLAQGLDITINGTSAYTNVAFGSTEPSSGYKSIGGGTDPIEVFLTGQTANPLINSNLSLGSGTVSTVFLTGNYATSAAVTKLTDNNKAPTSGNVEFRFMNASPSTSSFSLDIYIVPPGTDITNVTPDISGLQFTQASSYITKSAGGYEVVVTASGNKVPLITPPDYTLTTGQIRTLIAVDALGGGALSNGLLELNDLN